MGWMWTVVREVWGLFVDDGSFAGAIVVWVGLMWMVLHSIRVSGAVSSGVLFAGLGAILVESLLRFARRGRG